MKMIALEEAFSMEGLRHVPKIGEFPGIKPELMKEWLIRAGDFTRYRLPEMDAHGVDVHVLSLNALGIQAIPDADTAVQSAIAPNDYLAQVIGTNPDRFGGFAALPMQNPVETPNELRRASTSLDLRRPDQRHNAWTLSR